MTALPPPPIVPGTVTAAAPLTVSRATTESLPTRIFLVALSLIFLFIFLILPLAVVFYEAFAHGLRAYWETLSDPGLIDSVYTTLIAVGIAVPLNVCFGLA